MPTLVIRHPDGSEQEQELSGNLFVGRAEGNDLMLVEGGVSRKHARFFTQGDEVLVEDAGSANGTFVDGTKIDGATALGEGTAVTIGDYEISLKPVKSAKAGNGIPRSPRGAKPLGGRGASEVSPPRATKMVKVPKPDAQASALAPRRPARTARTAAGPQLRGMSGAVLDQVFPLKGTMMVGRVAGVDLQLDDDSVSRKHAELIVEGGRVVVRDLNSANGTAVNGAPVDTEAELSPGDIIQFGVVELSFEAAERRVSARAGGASTGPRALRRRADDREEAARAGSGGPAAARRKRLMMMAVGVGGFLVLLLVAKAAMGPEPETKKRPVPSKAQAPVPFDLTTQLTICRQYSSTDLGDPDWERAEKACMLVLQEEPIHAEASALVKKIRAEKKCQDFYERANKAASRLREDEALELYSKIDCADYTVKATPKVREVVDTVRKKALDDCKSYVNNAMWEQALPRCEQYMKIACQPMKLEELYPPAMKQMCIDSGGKNCWRPKDPSYLLFLRARQKVDPKAPMWRCPAFEILKPAPAAPKQEDRAKTQFSKRLSDPELVEALTLYFTGKFPDAINILQRVKEQVSKAQSHVLAESMRKDIINVMSLRKEGDNYVAQEKPELAEEPFLEALELDSRLVLGEGALKLTPEEKTRELEKLSSSSRRDISQSMAAGCRARGVAYYARSDRKNACRVWRLGASFWRGDMDLLNQLTEKCTKYAGTLFEKASDCDALTRVLDYAVKGDNFAEKVAEKKAQQGCP